MKCLIAEIIGLIISSIIIYIANDTYKNAKVIFYIITWFIVGIFTGMEILKDWEND